MCNHDNENNAADWEREVKSLRRKVKLLERDNRMLVVMNQNAEQLRRSYEAEKNLQYLYNDLLLEHCPNMIILFNQQLRFVIGSQACGELLNTENRQDLVNMPFEKIFSDTVDADWIKKVHQQNQTVLQTLEPCRYDDTLLFPGNREMHVQVTVVPIVDDTGMCLGTVLSINDVTELVLARQREEEASASKSNFLANMSHEIRTPMNAIKGLSELLALTELNTLQRNYITNVISASNSLLGIINDVLDFSKIDAKKIEFVNVDYRLSEMITGVCNVVNVRAAEKNLVLHIDADPGLPSGLRGDDVRIKQIITNLLSNAVKYTTAGFVRIRMWMEQASGHNWLFCEVSDSGIGITEEDLGGIFGAFSRADLHSNRHINGTGLGLAIAKQLTLAMGGDLWVKSIYGEGSTFSFKIPQEITDPTPLAAVSDRETKKVLLPGDGVYSGELKRLLGDLGVVCQCCGGMPGDMEAFTHCILADDYDDRMLRELKARMPGTRFAEVRDMKSAVALSEDSGTVLYLPLFITDLAAFLNNQAEVHQAVDLQGSIDGMSVPDACALVVDDNEINRIVCREMLRGFSAAVDCAESGREAVRLCEKKKYDIIFMDHMMPGMDGVETTRVIREGGGINKDTPIVALTANVVNDRKSYYLNNGMDDFIGKPMDLSDLSRVLARWLPEKTLR